MKRMLGMVAMALVLFPALAHAELKEMNQTVFGMD